MKKVAKIISIVTGCVLVIALLGWLGMRFLIGVMCENKIIVENLSPDKGLKAILFTRDCGATTATSYQVSVVNSWDHLSNADIGNVFVSYGAPLLQWKNTRTLIITKAPAAKIFQQQQALKSGRCSRR